MRALFIGLCCMVSLSLCSCASLPSVYTGTTYVPYSAFGNRHSASKTEVILESRNPGVELRFPGWWTGAGMPWGNFGNMTDGSLISIDVWDLRVLPDYTDSIPDADKVYLKHFTDDDVEIMNKETPEAAMHIITDSLDSGFRIYRYKEKEKLTTVFFGIKKGMFYRYHFFAQGTRPAEEKNKFMVSLFRNNPFRQQSPGTPVRPMSNHNEGMRVVATPW
ncbi:MAG: hypothetical protein V4543_02055 [Bacteroidota bacterium]